MTKKLEEKMFEIIRRRDDDNDYGYADMVRDIEHLFGLTATRNAIRLEKLKGKPLEGALKVIAVAVGEE